MSLGQTGREPPQPLTGEGRCVSVIYVLCRANLSPQGACRAAARMHKASGCRGAEDAGHMVPRSWLQGQRRHRVLLRCSRPRVRVLHIWAAIVPAGPSDWGTPCLDHFSHSAGPLPHVSGASMPWGHISQPLARGPRLFRVRRRWTLKASWGCGASPRVGCPVCSSPRLGHTWLPAACDPTDFGQAPLGSQAYMGHAQCQGTTKGSKPFMTTMANSTVWPTPY